MPVQASQSLTEAVTCSGVALDGYKGVAVFPTRPYGCDQRRQPGGGGDGSHYLQYNTAEAKPPVRGGDLGGQGRQGGGRADRRDSTHPDGVDAMR